MPQSSMERSSTPQLPSRIRRLLPIAIRSSYSDTQSGSPTRDWKRAKRWPLYSTSYTGFKPTAEWSWAISFASKSDSTLSKSCQEKQETVTSGKSARFLTSIDGSMTALRSKSNSSSSMVKPSLLQLLPLGTADDYKSFSFWKNELCKALPRREKPVFQLFQVPKARKKSVLATSIRKQSSYITRENNYSSHSYQHFQQLFQQSKNAVFPRLCSTFGENCRSRKAGFVTN